VSEFNQAVAKEEVESLSREGINILEESQSKDQQSAIADRRFGTSFCIEPYKCSCTQGAIDVVECKRILEIGIGDS